MVDEKKQIDEIVKMLMDIPGAVTYQPNAYELPTHDPYKTKVAVSSNNGELTIDYNKLANAVHKYSYIKTREAVKELLNTFAGFRGCSMLFGQTWNAVAEEYGINVIFLEAERD